MIETEEFIKTQKIDVSETYAGMQHQPFFTEGSLAIIERLFFEEPTLDTRSTPLDREEAHSRLRSLQKTLKTILDRMEKAEMTQVTGKRLMSNLLELATESGLTPREKWNLSRDTVWKKIVLGPAGYNEWDGPGHKLEKAKPIQYQH
jgi:hypothetical protein